MQASCGSQHDEWSSGGGRAHTAVRPHQSKPRGPCGVRHLSNACGSLAAAHAQHNSAGSPKEVTQLLRHAVLELAHAHEHRGGGGGELHERDARAALRPRPPLWLPFQVDRDARVLCTRVWGAAGCRVRCRVRHGSRMHACGTAGRRVPDAGSAGCMHACMHACVTAARTPA